MALRAITGDDSAVFPDFNVEHDHEPAHDAQLMAHHWCYMNSLLKAKKM